MLSMLAFCIKYNKYYRFTQLETLPECVFNPLLNFRVFSVSVIIIMIPEEQRILKKNDAHFQILIHV